MLASSPCGGCYFRFFGRNTKLYIRQNIKWYIRTCIQGFPPGRADGSGARKNWKTYSLRFCIVRIWYNITTLWNICVVVPVAACITPAETRRPTDRRVRQQKKPLNKKPQQCSADGRVTHARCCLLMLMGGSVVKSCSLHVLLSTCGVCPGLCARERGQPKQTNFYRYVRNVTVYRPGSLIGSL